GCAQADPPAAPGKLLQRRSGPRGHAQLPGRDGVRDRGRHSQDQRGARGGKARGADPPGLRAVTVVHAVMLAGALGGGPGFTATGTGGSLMPLVLTLPPPAFSGTPKNIPPGTTVEKPTGRKRPPILVPRDVTNVGRGKPVTAGGSRPR